MRKHFAECLSPFIVAAPAKGGISYAFLRSVTSNTFCQRWLFLLWIACRLFLCLLSIL